MVELNVHGSVAVVRDLLATLQQCDELEPATAGEFTRQAFVNSRLDLTEVEGLADLIAAETSQQRRQALRQLRGELGALYNEWRSTVVEALARSEALIDFGDDELIDNSVISQSMFFCIDNRDDDHNGDDACTTLFAYSVVSFCMFF